jgi:hypothetical protein
MPALLLIAQEADEPDEEVSVLLRGPIRRKGLPYIYPNALTTYFGEYDFRGEMVTLFYAEGNVVPDEEWEPFVCTNTRLFVIPGGSGTTLFYRNSAGWVVIFSVPEGARSGADICPFITVFLDRFTYFRGISRQSGAVSFPAVLNL